MLFYILEIKSFLLTDPNDFASQCIYFAEGQTAQKALLLNIATPRGIFPNADQLEQGSPLTRSVYRHHFQM